MDDIASQRMIHCLGSDRLNWYLLEHELGLTIIDCGFPAYWQQLQDVLSKRKRPLTDVKAIVLTHAHNDHKGFAERLRQASGATVYVHEADRSLAQSSDNIPPKGFLRNLWRPAVRRLMAHAMFEAGAFSIQPVRQVSTFSDDERLAIPGGVLRVIHTPGHTPGHCCLLLEDRQVLFSGDALVTMNLYSGKHGLPQLLSDGVNHHSDQALQSLDRLVSIGRMTMLPGHGKAWRGDMVDAVAIARHYQMDRAF